MVCVAELISANGQPVDSRASAAFEPLSLMPLMILSEGCPCNCMLVRLAGRLLTQLVGWLQASTSCTPGRLYTLIW